MRNEKAPELLQAGRKQFSAGDYAGATTLFLQAITAAEGANDRSSLIQALSLAARGHLIRELRAEGQPYLDRAAALASPADPRSWSSYLGVKGRFEWRGGDHATAKTTFIQWYEFCVQHDMPDPAIDAVHMIAIVASPDEQIEWGKKGIAVAAKHNQGGWLGPLWNNLGWQYFERRDYDQALHALLQARHYHHLHSHDLARLAADIFVGKVYRAKGDLPNAKQWLTAARTRAAELYAQRVDNDTSERLGNCHEECGEIDITEGRKDEGLAQLREARHLYVAAGAEKWGPEEIKRIDDRLAALNA